MCVGAMNWTWVSQTLSFLCDRIIKFNANRSFKFLVAILLTYHRPANFIKINHWLLSRACPANFDWDISVFCEWILYSFNLMETFSARPSTYVTRIPHSQGMKCTTTVLSDKVLQTVFRVEKVILKLFSAQRLVNDLKEISLLVGFG